MRIILLIAVIALGVDAVLYSGSYTQSAWRESVKLFDKAGTAVKDTANRN